MKRQKLESDQVNSMDTKLMELDNQCAKEQMVIQRKFDEKKKPLFEERRSIIKNIPNFWADAISRHPVFLENMHPEDYDVLKYLNDIELDDNLDDEGSYRIKFVFDESVSEIMEPNVLIKHVVFNDNRESVQEVTKINWKKDSPRSTIEKKFIEDKNTESELDSTIVSFFDFFSEEIQDDALDIGEIIRRDIYHAPLLYYCDDDQSQSE
ncbi:putative nucleosome assembly protein [Cryptosporidium felis]|nr:putative nucleosome assembly protein [Cryptosporidium felis]